MPQDMHGNTSLQWQQRSKGSLWPDKKVISISKKQQLLRMEKRAVRLVEPRKEKLLKSRFCG